MSIRLLEEELTIPWSMEVLEGPAVAELVA